MPDPLLDYLQQQQPDRVVLLDGDARRCRICNCTQDHACLDPEHGACWWVEDDLCSHCGVPAIVAGEYDRLQAIITDNWATADGAAELRRWGRKARTALRRASQVDPKAFEI